MISATVVRIMTYDLHEIVARNVGADGRYSYKPSFPAAVVFFSLYVLATIINLWQWFFYRAWFWWVMNFAIICKLWHLESCRSYHGLRLVSSGACWLYLSLHFYQESRQQSIFHLADYPSPCRTCGYGRILLHGLWTDNIVGGSA